MTTRTKAERSLDELYEADPERADAVVFRRRAGPSPKGPQLLDLPGKDKGLVILGERPLVAETAEQLLDDETTPTAKFFIRNNGQVPEAPANAEPWKITIEGEVDKKLELSL